MTCEDICAEADVGIAIATVIVTGIVIVIVTATATATEIENRIYQNPARRYDRRPCEVHALVLGLCALSQDVLTQGGLLLRAKDTLLE